jgi:membrane protease YdiL (CAAX protease family)
MQRIYSARTELEAHDVRLYLASQGIQAFVDGESAAFTNFAFTPTSGPGVVVKEEDAERAITLVEHFLERPQYSRPRDKWTCTQCGEVVESQFDACWKCEAPRGDSDSIVAFEESTACPQALPSEVLAVSSLAVAAINSSESDGRNRGEIWLEVGVALAVTWLPYFAYSILTWAWPIEKSNWSFGAESLSQVVNLSIPGIVVLYLIHRGGTPWRVHGIRRPRLFPDIASGILIWFISMVAVGIVHQLGVSVVGNYHAGLSAESTFEFSGPTRGSDYAFVILLSLCIAFNEELAMRGYLIPRFEQLLGSTPKSIALTTLLFASYHLYQGIGAMLLILVMGLVFGVAFCRMRRLWPVVVAHAIADLLALSSLG